nr:PREDICTED: voltage-gated potassium channel subunit beta-1-like [Anolis carolinensis]|eukprot:XP_008122993.2 PREDICTED: voltage-gated potassium channel subunit beta-1-like [Anolis carolinensis]
MLSVTYSGSLRSVASRCLSEYGLGPASAATGDPTADTELRRMRDVRSAAQAKVREEFLRMHGLSALDGVAHQTGMAYRNLGKSGLRVSCLGLGKAPKDRDIHRSTEQYIL